MSERRLNRLLSPHLNGALPAFLTRDPGPRRGFAGAQYPATALVAETRTLCSAASIQSVPANGDNQDVVSMGLIGARTAKRVVRNTSYILAIEHSLAGRAVRGLVRAAIPPVEEDRYMTDEIELAAELIRKGSLLSAVEEVGIKLV